MNSKPPAILRWHCFTKGLFVPSCGAMYFFIIFIFDIKNKRVPEEYPCNELIMPICENLRPKNPLIERVRKNKSTIGKRWKYVEIQMRIFFQMEISNSHVSYRNIRRRKKIPGVEIYIGLWRNIEKWKMVKQMLSYDNFIEIRFRWTIENIFRS